MRIGITGSTGVLGKKMMDLWKGPEFVPFRGDITNFPQVKTWYQEAGQLDALLHLAALVPVQVVEADHVRALQTNVGGTFHLLEAVRTTETLRKPWFFFASTSHVYATSETPVTEESLTRPISIYGQTKLQADQWCQTYIVKYQLPICVGRIFSFSAPKQHPTYFVPATMDKILKAGRGATIEARGLNGTRDFLRADQICDAVQFLFRKEAVGVFNIGTGHRLKLLDLANALKHRLKRDDVEIKALDYDINHLVADVTKLRDLGFQLKFDLEKFLDEVI